MKPAYADHMSDEDFAALDTTPPTRAWLEQVYPKTDGYKTSSQNAATMIAYLSERTFEAKDGYPLFMPNSGNKDGCGLVAEWIRENTDSARDVVTTIFNDKRYPNSATILVANNYLDDLWPNFMPLPIVDALLKRIESFTPDDFKKSVSEIRDDDGARKNYAFFTGNKAFVLWLDISRSPDIRDAQPLKITETESSPLA